MIVYERIPYKRNQDIIRISDKEKGADLVISLVDGYSKPGLPEGDRPGREIARTVGKLFPQYFLNFLNSKISDLQIRAEKTALLVDRDVLKRFPKYVACVGIFLFEIQNKQVIVTVGSVIVYVWNGRRWFKPKEIGDYSLDPKDPKSYGSDVSRFFGGGDNKDKPLFSCKPDVVEIDIETSIFLATDGLEDVFTLKDFNNFTYKLKNKRSQSFIKKLTREIKKRNNQKDDISILIKGHIE
ncbi:protein phosphatase 2C family protein [Candidatus Roizmanbacteria bacterium]|nr:protein phosphatase 2C family protein [Candidatus Roizmanbacteria bacterium]